MDEVTRLIPLWSASKPDEYIFIPEKPHWACFKCGKSFWREPTKVIVAKCNPFGVSTPLSVWIATSECFVCNEPHKWLINPDKPLDPSESKDFGNPIGEHYYKQYGAVDDALDKYLSPPPEENIWDENPKQEKISFDDFCKNFGESDLQAYIRWLKSQQRRRDEDDIDPNDAS